MRRVEQADAMRAVLLALFEHRVEGANFPPIITKTLSGVPREMLGQALFELWQEGIVEVLERKNAQGEEEFSIRVEQIALENYLDRLGL